VLAVHPPTDQVHGTPNGYCRHPDAAHRGDVDPLGGRLVTSPRSGGSGRSETLTLASRIAEGDRDAFLTLYDRLAPVVIGILRRRGLGARAAEELGGAIFERIWREAPQLRRGGVDESAWMVGLIDDAMGARRPAPPPV
jgi:hypothetical protein